MAIQSAYTAMATANGLVDAVAHKAKTDGAVDAAMKRANCQLARPSRGFRRLCDLRRTPRPPNIDLQPTAADGIMPPRLKPRVRPVKTIHTPSEASVPSTAPECRDCRVAMDAGLMLDRTHGGSEQPMWIKGTADKGIFGLIKERDRERLPVVTFRCPKCGRLESFAQTV